jgi:ABC-2 type transport system permease protein
MNRHILRHEWRLLVADRTLGLVFAIFLACFGYATFNGVRAIDAQQQAVAAAVAEEAERRGALREELAAIEAGGAPASPRSDPRSPAVMGGNRGARLAALPQAPLAPLSIGQSDLLPHHYTVTINTNAQAFLASGDLENPLNLMAGRFDVAFVLVFLLPLLILALSFNLLSAEREQGTLLLTMAQPTPVRGVLLQRAVLRALLVLAMAAGITIVGAIAGGLRVTADGVVAGLLVWILVVAAYSMLWFALALLINSFGHGSGTNATVLAAAWLATVVVAPAAVNIGASMLHPLPSRVELIATQRDAARQATERRSEILAQFFEDHPEMVQGLNLDTMNVAARSYASQQEVDRKVGEVLERFDRQLDAQQAVVRRYRYISPAILMQEALNDLSGTGDQRFASFRGDVARFAGEWRAYFVPHLLAGERLGSEKLAGAPDFYFIEDPGPARRRAAGSAGLIGFGALLAGGIGVRRMGRVSALG